MSQTSPLPMATSEPSVVRTRAPQNLFTAPFRAQAWRDAGYHLLLLLTAPFAFAYSVLCIVLTAAFSVTVVWLYLPGWLVVGARGWGGLYRGYARGLGAEVAAPLPWQRGKGFWRGLGRTIGDAAGWRTVLFMFIALPLSILSAVLVIVFLALSLGCVTYGIWYRFLPLQQAADGTWHRGAQLWDGTPMDNTAGFLTYAGIGVVFWFLWPQLARGLAAGWTALIGLLLGPTQASLRVAALHSSRGRTVEDADAKLRWIERDLHDGTQARLVALAMQLGEAKETLETSPDSAHELVTDAHGAAKDALTELRELARGIRPPALEAGLAVAVETLAARSSLPVAVDLADGLRPAPSIESIAYFSLAELVTNAAKHAGASGV